MSIGCHESSPNRRHQWETFHPIVARGDLIFRRCTPTTELAGTDAVIAVIAAAHATFSRHNPSAGPVVALFAVITLVALSAVLAMSYLIHLRDRR